VRDRELLFAADSGSPRLWLAIVEAGGGRWQLLLGERPDGDEAEFLHGRDDAVVGRVGDRYFYDGTLDPVLGLALLDLVTGGSETAARVRPLGAEQSNTSLVYDDRLLVKIFRRLVDGPQPDVEVPARLESAGFEHVPHLVAAWHRRGDDLALAQEFLVGGLEGWAAALTSLRDLYGEGPEDPAEAGGDFYAESGRLGRMTAELHLALASVYDVSRDEGRAEEWAASMTAAVSGLEGELDLQSEARNAIERLRRVADPGAAIRVHGDLHLGQVLRTDTGWYILDFEGEPARAREQRIRPTSPFKDVAGMIRSFGYAAAAARRERVDEEEADALIKLGAAWEDRNRQAFLRGYLGYPGIDELLPADEASRAAVMDAFELEKTLYELAYERSYRPDWAEIPRAALRRQLGAP
jgi:maltokinase